MRGQLIISAHPAPRGVRVRLAALVGGVLAALVLLAGCSNDTPMPGENGPTATDSTTAIAPSTPSASSSALPGLTDDCTDAVHAQIAISTLFEGAVSGKPLTSAQVTSTFTPLLTAVPKDLSDDVEVLHQAAVSAIGKDQVAVAGILADTKTAAAMSSLTDYVKGCTPATS